MRRPLWARIIAVVIDAILTLTLLFVKTEKCCVSAWQLSGKHIISNSGLPDDRTPDPGRPTADDRTPDRGRPTADDRMTTTFNFWHLKSVATLGGRPDDRSPDREV